MKTVITLFIALLITGIATLHAQNNRISGRITDENRQPVELANIALLTTDSTFVQGTCSRADGTFEIVPATPSGKWLVQISCIGYETLYRTVENGTPETYVLKDSSVQLGEAVVTARRPVYRLKGGTLETSVQHSLLASLNNANDVLKHIPGLHVSDDTYTVFGKGSPIVYIDNRLLQDLSELERLSAADIEKVELITNPGAEYGADVKAVIRIRTVRNKRNGFGGSLRTSLNQRRRTSHLEQISLNYQQGGLSVLGMAYTNFQQSQRTQDVRYQIPSSVQWDINSHSAMKHHGLMAGGSTSLSYDFNPKHSLGMSYEYHRTPGFYIDIHSQYSALADDQPTDRTNYVSENLQQSTAHQVNAYYTGTVGKLQINLTADLLHRQNYDHQEAHEDNEQEADRDISSYNRATSRLYASKLVLSHPLGKNATLKAGGDYTFIRRKDFFLNVQNLLPDTDSRIHESKAAAFAEYTHTLGSVSLLAGLRFEHAAFRYWEDGQYVAAQSRTYNDWGPNLALNFPLGRAQANLSYTVKTNRPSFFQLRSTLSYNNRFVYEGGNPDLLPETHHDLQFSTLYKWIQFNLYYQYRRNPIAFMTKDYEGNPDAVIFTTANHKRMQYLNASLHLSPAIGLWRPSLGILFTQPFFSVVNQGVSRQMNRGSIYLVCQNTLSLPHEWILSVDADYQSEGNFGAQLQGSYWGVDAGLRKTFLQKRLTLGLQATDLWNSRYSKFMLFGPRLTYTRHTNPDSRSVVFSLNYRFNAAGKAYKGKHAAEDDLKRL